MDLLDLVREAGIDPGKKVASTAGGEYHCPCPKCGGDDRFIVQPNKPQKKCIGKYWCRNCDPNGGDSLNFCREYLGLSWDDAQKKIGVSISLEDKRYFLPKKQTQSFTEVICPPDAWLRSAETFVQSCHEELYKSPGTISILETRGIPIGVFPRYRLGFCKKEEYQEREAWGLEPEFTDDGKKKGLWLPKGIAIPIIDGGRVVRINIRRTEWKPEDSAVKNKKSKGKYIKVSGGMKGLNIIGDTTRPVMLVVESELDAIALNVACSDFALSIAISGKDASPDRVTDYLAKNKQHLLICHDNDEPGREMLKKWKGLYPHARAWPTLEGKDVGEFAQQGGNIRNWILDALPDELLCKL
jgi:DNA primase